MVSTIKFSEFAASDRNLSTNKNVGLSGGANAQADLTVTWTTATRPSSPYNGLLGYNTDLSEYEFYATVSSSWIPVSGGGGSGTVTLINTGVGLTGGPITTTGTISFAAIASNSFWANTTGVNAVPAVTSLSLFLLAANNLSDVPNKPQARINLGLEIGVDVEAWSPALDSIAGLTTVANNLIYTTASDTYAVIAPSANSAMVSSAGGLPSWSQTLPTAVQTNITRLGALAQALNMNSHQINNITDPTNPQDAATMVYVTSQLGNYLPLIGGTMAGAINMGNHKITNMTDPSSGQDAVTVTYLNAQLANYLALSGGTMTGAINMGSFKITNLLDPTNPQDAATKNYVDLVATGLAVQPACYAATTGNLTAIYVNGASGIGATLTNSGALAQFQTDGTTPPTNARILVWQQSSTLENGIYVLTNQGSGAVAWILTRATDYDQPAEIQPGDLVIINNGTLYGGSSFIETASVSAIGTDPILFSQFTFSASAVLLKANNLSDVANTTTSFNNISPLTTKGDLIGYNAGNVRVPVGMSDGQIMQVSSGAGPGIAWSTATYPVTTTANQLLYSSSTNVVTGLATAVGGVLVTDASSVPSILANPGATGRIFQSANSAIPAWSTATYPSVATSTGSFLYANGTNWVASTSLWPNTVGAAGKIIRSDGTTNAYTTATFADTYSASVLLYSNGANAVTGLATANSASLVTSSTGVPAWTASMTNGQIIIGNSGATPAPATLTAGTNISITNGAGSITINATGAGGGSWVVETTTSRTFTAFQGVITNNGSLVTLTIPATFSVGDIFEVAGLGAGGWKIQLNTGQVGHLNSSATTSAGSFASTNQYNTMKLLGVVANTTLVALSNNGSITVA